MKETKYYRLTTTNKDGEIERFAIKTETIIERCYE